MCSAAAIGPAFSAIAGAQEASASNARARRNWEHQLKVRERKWMQTRTTYATKKVQFEEEVDLATVAAQRAYTRTQLQLNNAKSLAILENQEDFKKMLVNEGQIEASAAERGVRGKSVARLLAMNTAQFGTTQAMRSRGLAIAGYKAKESMEDVRRQLKSTLNQSFSKVAIEPVQDVAPPPPVMQNVGMTFMLGMGQALAAGIGGMSNTGDALSDTTGGASTTAGGVSTGSIDYGNTFPSGSFGYGSAGTRSGLANNRQLYL
tara:strand:- start:633 stop:1418 length:786 start_codon:yes stop_codon:yes gene_type:complete